MTAPSTTTDSPNLNPKNPGMCWDLSGPFTKAEIIAKARVRFEPAFDVARHELLTRMWFQLEPFAQEFLLSGMYDGINCDNCGQYIPDVPDYKDRLCIGKGDSTICAVCFDLEQAAKLQASQLTRFDFKTRLPDGSSVYGASHELWNEVLITFPPGYFNGLTLPGWVELESFIISNLEGQ